MLWAPSQYLLWETAMTTQHPMLVALINALKPIGLSTVLAAATLTAEPVTALAAQLDTPFDPNNFTAGVPVNNPYWPLIPGTSFVYTDQSKQGCEAELFEVTYQTKSDFAAPYDTIVATEINDRTWLSPQCDGNYALMETSLDWYVQDNAGNEWYFGEQTEAYDDPTDCPSAAGSWASGNDGAQPGVVMLAQPEVGVSYQQEFLAGVAEDMAKVLRLNATVHTEAGTFEDCLVTKEWSPLELGIIEQKFYCPSGGGNTLIKGLKGKTLQTELVGDTLPPGNYAQAGVCL
jgi:hypothetical protein